MRSIRWLWLVVVGLLAARLVVALAACGHAGQVSSSVACATLHQAIAARADYTAERAYADIGTVSEVCSRLAAAPDAGAP